MTHHSHSSECCRRCGSRELEYERVRHQGVRIVSCLDCGAVFEIRRPSAKSDNSPRRQAHRDRHDIVAGSELDEDSGYYDE